MRLKLKIFMDSGQRLKEIIDWKGDGDTPSPEDIGRMMQECHGIRTEDTGWLYVDDKAIDAIVIHPVVSDPGAICSAIDTTIGSAECDCRSPVVVWRVVNSNLFEGECSYCGHMVRVREDEVVFADKGYHDK